MISNTTGKNMPSWNEALNEITQEINRGNKDALDTIRRKYLLKLYENTDRNVIAYYSAWLSKPGLAGTQISDQDKAALMATVYKLDRSKGLDLILHTPGGDIAGEIVKFSGLKSRSDGDPHPILKPKINTNYLCQLLTPSQPIPAFFSTLGKFKRHR